MDNNNNNSNNGFNVGDTVNNIKPKKFRNVGGGLKKAFIPLIIVLVALVIAMNSFTVVEPGHTGVVVTLGKVEDGVLQEGMHAKIPFVQSIVMIDNRIRKLEVDTEAFSKDLQSVDTTLAVNYRVDTSKSYSIYKNIGADYESILVTPSVNEVLKAIASSYTAEQSVTNRAVISDGLVTGLNEKLNAIGLYVTDVNIVNFDFSEAYINAIEEKQVAQQKLLKAETEKQTAITNAQAEAEATKIRAEAEAEANRLISESLTDEVIENKKIEKWNGELPRVTGAGGTMLDMSSVIGDSETTGGYDNEYYGE
jgi:regulator of protease activity HflC (stomatin/prohibitin superfamily)